jgi:hypothetical protein
MTSLQFVRTPLSRHERQGEQYFYGARYAEVEVPVAEAWTWLESQLFVVPADAMNARNGFRVLGRRSRSIRI